MKSTFFYKEHSKVVEEKKVQADYVEFPPGWVIFYETIATKTWPWTSRRIIKAVHSEACHDVREVVND